MPARPPRVFRRARTRSPDRWPARRRADRVSAPPPATRPPPRRGPRARAAARVAPRPRRRARRERCSRARPSQVAQPQTELVHAQVHLAAARAGPEQLRGPAGQIAAVRVEERPHVLPLPLRGDLPQPPRRLQPHPHPPPPPAPPPP